MDLDEQQLADLCERLSLAGGSDDAFDATVRLATATPSGVAFDATLTPADAARAASQAATADPAGSSPVASASASASARTFGVVLGDRLGAGGMGVVRTGRQLGLERAVAVKGLHAPIDPIARAALLQEAVTAAYLEHPNIVPVHALGEDADGNPLLLMRQIEGTPWHELMARDRASGRGGVRPDRIDAHLEILRQVCHAVHYAHSRGVIHRDLKPANVMVGAFGEVYVLDWGIAAAVGDLPPAIVPRASAASGPAGTPGYMAPEMFVEPASVDQRCDVYLLGGILHELLAGEPPHAAPTLLAALQRALRADPRSYTGEVPTALSAIAHRALAADPADRYPDAAAFREALDDYQRQRSSIQLCEEAKLRLRQLDRLLRSASDRPAREAIYRTFAECRFGFRQALRSWPENDEARVGMQRAVRGLIEFELERENAEAAEALLAELPTPDEALAERVASARARRASERQELQQLRDEQRDRDLDAMERPQRVLDALVLLVFVAVPAGSIALRTAGVIHISYPLYVLVATFSAVVMAASYALLRRRWETNRAGREFVALLFAGAATLILHRAVVWITATPLPSGFATDLPIVAFTIFAIGLTVERRLLAAAAAPLLVLPPILVWPAHALELFCVALSLTAITVIRAWRRRPDQPEP